MRIVHGIADLEKDSQPSSYIQLAIVAPTVDRLSIDILSDQKGVARRGHATIQKTRDVVVVQRGQQLALALEAAQKFRPDEVSGHDFERNGLLELAIGAASQINRTHASLAKQLNGSIGAKAGTGNAGR